MIKVDFENDWREFPEQDVALYASQYDPSRTRKKNTITTLNAKGRPVPRRGRTAHESKELQIPPQHSSDDSSLKKLRSEGGDPGPLLEQRHPKECWPYEPVRNKKLRPVLFAAQA